MLRNRSIAALAVLVCVVTAGLGAVFASTSVARTPAKASPKLSITSTSIGKILTTNGGLIVFIFMHDTKNKNTCPASTGCAAQWPPLLGTPSLGKGVDAKLIGKIKYGKQYQVTYDGRPLYGYIYNSTSISYVGYKQFGGAWNAISPTGKVVTNPGAY